MSVLSFNITRETCTIILREACHTGLLGLNTAVCPFVIAKASIRYTIIESVSYSSFDLVLTEVSNPGQGSRTTPSEEPPERIAYADQWKCKKFSGFVIESSRKHKLFGIALLQLEVICFLLKIPNENSHKQTC